jgi:hypothetical protein
LLSQQIELVPLRFGDSLPLHAQGELGCTFLPMNPNLAHAPPAVGAYHLPTTIVHFLYASSQLF